MTTVGIISDTHGCWDRRYAMHFNGCDEIWHAGDVGDIDIINRLKEVAPVVRAVYGNADHGAVRRLLPETEDFYVEGLHVWMTHIGGYPGRYAPGVARLLRQENVGLMVCGHSHILKVISDPLTHVLHINPGAAGLQGWHQVRTLVRLKIDNAVPRDLEVIEMSRSVIYD